ncbi:glutathione peroxidase [Candidatus Vallotia tarda]|uniref:Glutathione peroxidase homolog BsaA n=1 Tax=Candidatus Vallotiella hemipterorum TaxID=1177213 RepID=A0A916JTK8_9BURK|nr:glutathione peroxidase [Candidatus Vallotia tarda]CAG7602319.1 Glutathione peroxidase homolog BsaA [Candidatus Vallotia tarda]
MNNIYLFSAQLLGGEDIMLERYRGKVLLIVNTASACHFASQYKELQILYKQYAACGLEILDFPCNQFGKQELRTATQIEKCCYTNSKVKFPVFNKINVNGIYAHPLYYYLTRKVPGILGIKAIKWNFTKFLITREGQPVKRYAPITRPSLIAPDIEKFL